MKSFEEFRDEFEFDPESAIRIAEAVRNYPLSLKGCADIIEIVAPLCEYLSMDGAIRFLNRAVSERLLKERNPSRILTAQNGMLNRLQFQRKSWYYGL